MQAYYWAPHGFRGSGENGYLFTGSWEALVIISRDLGSKFIVLGIWGALQKRKKFNLNNLTLKEKPSFRFIFLKKSSASGGKPPRPPLGNLSVFTFVLTTLLQSGRNILIRLSGRPYFSFCFYISPTFFLEMFYYPYSFTLKSHLHNRNT